MSQEVLQGSISELWKTNQSLWENRVSQMDSDRLAEYATRTKTLHRTVTSLGYAITGIGLVSLFGGIIEHSPSITFTVLIMTGTLGGLASHILNRLDHRREFLERRAAVSPHELSGLIPGPI